MNKRGLSPVVAALLFIFFAVVLLVIVVIFGKTNDTHGEECTADVRLKLAIIGGEDQICFNEEEKNIEFIIENGPNVEVEGLIVNLFTSRKVKTFEFDEVMIGKAGSYIGQIPYNEEIDGKIRQVKITPKVFLCDEEPIPVEDALIASRIQEC